MARIEYWNNLLTSDPKKILPTERLIAARHQRHEPPFRVTFNFMAKNYWKIWGNPPGRRKIIDIMSDINFFCLSRLRRPTLGWKPAGFLSEWDDFSFRHKSDVLKWNNTIVIQLRILSWNHAKSWHKRHLSSCGFPVTRFFRDYKFQNPFKFFQKFYLPLRNKLCAIIVTQKIEFRIYFHMILSLKLYKNLPKFWLIQPETQQTLPKKPTSRAEQHSSTGSKAFMA